MSEQGPEQPWKIGKLPPIGLGSKIRRATNYDAAGIHPAEYERRVLSEGRRYEAHEIGDLIQKAAPPIRSDGQPAQVLDVAAGTGILSRELTSRGYRVTATDLSATFLEYLSKRSPEIATVQADMNVGFPEVPDGSMDVVTMLGSNRYITNMDGFLGEVERVLSPGGKFIWPVLEREGNLWKKNAGNEQPTTASELREVLEGKNFGETSNRTIFYSLRGSPYDADKNKPIDIVVVTKSEATDAQTIATPDIVPAQPPIMITDVPNLGERQDDQGQEKHSSIKFQDENGDITDIDAHSLDEGHDEPDDGRSL